MYILYNELKMVCIRPKITESFKTKLSIGHFVLALQEVGFVYYLIISLLEEKQLVCYLHVE